MNGNAFISQLDSQLKNGDVSIYKELTRVVKNDAVMSKISSQTNIDRGLLDKVFNHLIKQYKSRCSTTHLPDWF